MNPPIVELIDPYENMRWTRYQEFSGGGGGGGAAAAATGENPYTRHPTPYILSSKPSDPKS